MADFKQTGPFSRQSAAYVERIPGQIWSALQGIGRGLAKTGQYLSSEQASQDYTNLLQGRFPNVGRSAVAAPKRQAPPPPPALPRPAPVVLPAGTVQPGAIVRGLTPTGDVDRSQGDEYKAQLSQYRNLIAKEKQAEAEDLGMKIWQEKYGKTPLAQPGGAVGAYNPLLAKMFPETKGLAGTAAAEATAFPDYQSGAQPLSDLDSFSMAANGVPAPWNQQGAKVSADFSGVVPFQAAKTTGEGMPAFQTTGDKAAEFLKRVGFGTAF